MWNRYSYATEFYYHDSKVNILKTGYREHTYFQNVLLKKKKSIKGNKFSQIKQNNNMKFEELIFH